jgi:SAM-dependent methyltransferase
MPDPMHFDRHAGLYDRARPPYPDALRDRLAEMGLLVAGRRAVDLGAGSGQATRLLVEAGMDVTAIEPGSALAARLRQALPGVRVLQTTAERAGLAPASFDLATAATSVHWFDLDAVLPKLHTALVPSGRLAVWRTVYGDPAAPPTPFRERVARIAAERDAPPRPGPGETETAEWGRRLSARGLFRVTHVEEFRWSVDLDADAVAALFTTFSDWSAAEAEEAARAVRELGGVVTEHYVTPLLVLDRVDR